MLTFTIENYTEKPSKVRSNERLISDSGIELVKEHKRLDRERVAIESYFEALDELEELTTSVESRELSPLNCKMIDNQLKYIRKKLGREHKSCLTVSFENFDTPTSVRVMMSLEEESKGILKSIWDAIVNFFKWIWNNIVKFWNWITGKKEEVESLTNELWDLHTKLEGIKSRLQYKDKEELDKILTSYYKYYSFPASSNEFMTTSIDYNLSATSYIISGLDKMLVHDDLTLIKSDIKQLVTTYKKGDTATVNDINPVNKLLGHTYCIFLPKLGDGSVLFESDTVPEYIPTMLGFKVCSDPAGDYEPGSVVTYKVSGSELKSIYTKVLPHGLCMYNFLFFSRKDEDKENVFYRNQGYKVIKSDPEKVKPIKDFLPDKPEYMVELIGRYLSEQQHYEIALRDIEKAFQSLNTDIKYFMNNVSKEVKEEDKKRGLKSAFEWWKTIFTNMQNAQKHVGAYIEMRKKCLTDLRDILNKVFKDNLKEDKK